MLKAGVSAGVIVGAGRANNSNIYHIKAPHPPRCFIYATEESGFHPQYPLADVLNGDGKCS